MAKQFSELPEDKQQQVKKLGVMVGILIVVAIVLFVLWLL